MSTSNFLLSSFCRLSVHAPAAIRPERNGFTFLAVSTNYHRMIDSINRRLKYLSCIIAIFGLVIYVRGSVQAQMVSVINNHSDEDSNVLPFKRSRTTCSARRGASIKRKSCLVQDWQIIVPSEALPPLLRPVLQTFHYQLKLQRRGWENWRNCSRLDWCTCVHMR